ncbi:50S ribosomal protein L23 [Endomicrobium proavitum]|uniref:Large ribosomal subunit protein uL23 n=1 Tax=Endomicrobium proavitum TaxID=1408281 RepID=A0A0G3WMF8_9BACT|nr:50S ribosomal protein L23 [Endomicrobium proavitum]AKL98674.1 50S ribosomal subunit protein L23 [Endomicrobium proavitum]
MDIRNIIKRPIVTEKAAVLKEADNKYTFVVDRNANKFQIKQAVETLFNVKVENVHTANYAGKSKRMGASSGYKNDWKKAIVKLKKGQEIQMVDEA